MPLQDKKIKLYQKAIAKHNSAFAFPIKHLFYTSLNNVAHATDDQCEDVPR